MEVVAARIIVRGRVQGVGFRWFARDAAAELTGWVRNRRDGSVELEVAGLDERVTALIAKLHQGPPASAVAAVDVQWLPAPGEEHAAPDAPSPREAGLQIRPTA